MKPVEPLHGADRVDTATLEAELEWLAAVIERRLQSYFDKEAPASPPLPDASLPPPALDPLAGPCAAALQRLRLDAQERLLLALALAPLLRPQLLDVLWTRNEATQRSFTEFGGLAVGHGPFVPTAETACFVLAGDDLALRLQAMRRLAPNGRLLHDGLLQLAASVAGDGSGAGAGTAAAATPAALSAAILPGARLLSEALPGVFASTAEGIGLAAPVATQLDWDDLVLPAATLAQLEDIGLWLAHGKQLLHDWGFSRRSGPGHVSLFHGPPGTGKTLSACLLGQRWEREVWRVDLSLVTSKYIGETEKNLSRLFDSAERQRWILFFDEADALFGKRTGVADAHDRYANQEVSYLLQRIEQFDGVVVLASNLRQNIDDAFLRRFHTMVPFALPKAAERLRLWRESIPPMVRPDAALDLRRLAQQHEVSGGTIVNVLRHACLRALGRGDAVLRAGDVDEGLRRELLKEGRVAM